MELWELIRKRWNLSDSPMANDVLDVGECAADGAAAMLLARDGCAALIEKMAAEAIELIE